MTAPMSKSDDLPRATPIDTNRTSAVTQKRLNVNVTPNPNNRDGFVETFGTALVHLIWRTYYPPQWLKDTHPSRSTMAGRI